MANHKSAKKRIRQTEKRRLINKSSLSLMKTLIKKVLDAKDKGAATEPYKAAVAHLDRIVTKGRIHKNNAARKKSQLTVYINNLPAGN